jgi:hypothetical protein
MHRRTNRRWSNESPHGFSFAGSSGGTSVPRTETNVPNPVPGGASGSQPERNYGIRQYNNSRRNFTLLPPGGASASFVVTNNPRPITEREITSAQASQHNLKQFPLTDNDISRPGYARRILEQSSPSLSRNSILPEMYRAQTTHQRDRREQRLPARTETANRTRNTQNAHRARLLAGEDRANHEGKPR